MALEMAESLTAKRVAFAEEKKSSGETWRRVAMMLKPALLRVLEALSETMWLMGLVCEVSSLASERSVMEIAMKAKITAMEK